MRKEERKSDLWIGGRVSGWYLYNVWSALTEVWSPRWLSRLEPLLWGAQVAAVVWNPYRVSFFKSFFFEEMIL